MPGITAKHRLSHMADSQSAASVATSVSTDQAGTLNDTDGSVRPGQTPEVPRGRSGLMANLCRLWPGIPFMGLGFFLAWLLLLNDTTSWISNIDASGSAANNAFLLIRLNIPLYAACAISLFICCFAHRPVVRFMNAKASVAVIGILGAVSIFLLIASGPYFFAGPMALNIRGLFRISAVLCGITAALLFVKCSYPYIHAKPFRIFAYSLLSELLAVVIYALVMSISTFAPYDGGPSYGGIAALLILPLLAALCPQAAHSASAAARQTARDVQAPAPEKPATVQTRKTVRSFVLLLIALFVFSLAVSLSAGNSVYNMELSNLQDATALYAFLRFALAGIILLLAVWKLQEIRLASFCVAAATVIAMLLSLFPLLGINEFGMYVCANVTSSLFDVAIWCLLCYAAGNSSLPGTRLQIFSSGYCAIMCGRALGWRSALSFLPGIVDAGQEIVVYVGLAMLVLLLTVMVFKGRDFEALFPTEMSQEFSLKSGEALKPLNHAGKSEKQHRWNQACDAIARQYGLSERERDIFGLLSRGYTADAIAQSLYISANTVRTHTHSIYGKLDIHNKQELIDLVNSRFDH